MDTELTAEPAIERARRLGVDLSWLDRARKHREEKDKPGTQKGDPLVSKHPLNMCWISQGATPSGIRMFLLVRYCRDCRFAEGVRLEASHEDYPLVNRSELNVVTTGMPRVCPAKEAEEAIEEYKDGKTNETTAPRE